MKYAVIALGFLAFSCVFGLALAQVLGYCGREQEKHEQWAEDLRRHD